MEGIIIIVRLGMTRSNDRDPREGKHKFDRTTDEWAVLGVVD